jgi:para-aminobenzoate synthetase/4-amino-4-deoxychorismate lyase
MPVVDAHHPPIVARIYSADAGWLSFAHPRLVLIAERPDAVRDVVGDVERLTRDRGLHAVGYLAYEAGEAFGHAPRTPRGDDLPLAWFALFDPGDVTPAAPPPVADGAYRLGPLQPSLDFDRFLRAFNVIRGHLAEGNSYQANFTFKLSGSFDGDAVALFADLANAQRGGHAAYLDLGDRAICSASPELFFALDGLEIRTRPMKGTTRRGRTLSEDLALRDQLVASAKQRAENVMIVDMVRNDLGRIAEVGSVAVPKLFTTERYPNLWQMTSDVVARTRAPLEAIVAALHPSASVTGAPKTRTMQILADLEPGPRGVYTGAIGHVRPDGNASFNVAIRTAIVDRRRSRVELGVGSGIVWDSDARSEYDECLLKGSILGCRPPSFDLLETLRWEPGTGFHLLDRHLARLRESAEYFARPCDLPAIRRALAAAVENEAAPRRVRLLVALDGTPRVEQAPLIARPGPLVVCLASKPVDDQDVFLFHKTTRRRVYDDCRAEAPGCDDVVLWNARGEVTESTTANLVVEIDGARFTPPVASGLLAGTCRAELLAEGAITEHPITLADLRAAGKWWLVNSVQGWRPARLTSSGRP